MLQTLKGTLKQIHMQSDTVDMNCTLEFSCEQTTQILVQQGMQTTDHHLKTRPETKRWSKNSTENDPFHFYRLGHLITPNQKQDMETTRCHQMVQFFYNSLTRDRISFILFLPGFPRL
jgi:hypothetical protein